MPLQPHALGAVVAEVTAHPSMEVGVTLGAGVAPAGGLREMVALGSISGGEGAGGG